MKSNIFYKNLPASLCLILFVVFSVKANRNINLTGLVMDVERLQPMEGASIFDANNKFLRSIDT